MKRLISFGSIKQFRNIIRDIQHVAQYNGQDEYGEIIYDKSIKMPKIMVTASEKIHGTNGAVCYSEPDGFWVQSRKGIITPEEDNAGCAFTANNQQNVWMDLITILANEYNIDLDENIISIYFEWCGGNIQKNSACSGLDRRAIIFEHFKVSPLERNENEDEEVPAKWYRTCTKKGWVDSPDNNIFNIMNFKIWEFEIDFECALLSQNEMIKIVEEIEPNSPAGKIMGKDGNIGEGIVVTFLYKDKVYKFKVKGEKHSVTKVKTLKPVNEEEEKAKIEFANYACSASRLEQAWQNTFGINNEIEEPNVKRTGDFLRAVINDIIKEESDIMAEKKLEPKIVNKLISTVARRWFMKELDKFYIK
jgi:hypothetical protein